ncbi:hypothetical protein C9374_011301 [Naegleria lovaniensis]|uniref:Uncharacterized protein n=1 Tax=Naegleria lovaniensis TaxID=51637 RepID=A0AA88H481_NAELO|nr:uncharacterized protein C9374_011301 [Naegleria lovaniensis]KAG2392576.1 hypothetical protein C9374_011301 [Naegleria lovaniensis]
MKTKLIQKITSNNFDLSGACAAFHNLFAIHHFSNENNRLEIFAIANDEGSLSVADEKKSASSDDDHQAVHLGESKSSTSSQKLYELDEVKSFCVVPLSTLFEERNLVICIMNDNSKKLIYISKFVKAGEYVVKAMENQLPSFINDSLDADCLMSSCSSGYFCYYSPSQHLLQIFKLNILNQQQLTFDKSADIDIFSKKAYSLQLTHSHVVLGQLNSIQVCDWKYQQMKLNSGDTASSMTTSKATGRIIYLPKITKTTKKKAKQGTVTEKNGLLVPKKEESDAGEGKTEQAASSIKKPTSTTGSEQETISTISKQRDEKVKSVKSLSNNSFIILSSLGNLYFLNCSKEDGDVFVKLSLPIVNDKLSKISSFDVMSNQLESLYNTSISSLLVLAFDNSESIVMTSLKSFYSLQQFKQPQSKEPGVVDIGIDSTFNLTDAPTKKKFACIK